MKSLLDIGDTWLRISIVIRVSDPLQFWIFRTKHQQPRHATSVGIVNTKDPPKVKKLERPKKQSAVELRQNPEKGPIQEGDPDHGKDLERLDQNQEIVLLPGMLEKRLKHPDQLEKRQELRCQKG